MVWKKRRDVSLEFLKNLFLQFHTTQRSRTKSFEVRWYVLRTKLNGWAKKNRLTERIECEEKAGATVAWHWKSLSAKFRVTRHVQLHPRWASAKWRQSGSSHSNSPLNLKSGNVFSRLLYKRTRKNNENTDIFTKFNVFEWSSFQKYVLAWVIHLLWISARVIFGGSCRLFWSSARRIL